MTTRRCSRCGGEYDEEAGFRLTRSVAARAATPSDRRPVCIPCEQTARDQKKEARRVLVKADRAIRSHTERFNKRHGSDLTVSHFVERFDWDRDQLAHDIEHAFTNGCHRCRRMFRDMPNGLANLTIDVIDPRQLPYYRTNIRVGLCKTCNSAKRDLTLEEDGKRLEVWAQWERRQEALHADPWLGTLFEGKSWEMSRPDRP